MNIIRNEKLIKRNARIGGIANLLGFGIMIAGFLYAWQGNQTTEVGIWLWVALLVGFAAAQIGIYFTNRFGRKPRLDEQLDQSLKGLGGDFTLYHYTSPVPHLLVGPAGVWVLLPFYQVGTFSFVKNRWRQRSTGFLHSYMRIFGQESIGRPEIEAGAEVESVLRKFKKIDLDAEWPEVKAALVFLSERAEVEPGDSPIPAMLSKKLKDFLRKQAKDTPLPKTQIEKINTALA
ncbi:MAG: hypothetical protein ACOYY3_08325 [Chloroflexota bacterium]